MSKNLDEAIIEGQIFTEEFTPLHQSLLYFLAANIKPLIRQHLKLLTKYIVTEKLNSEGKIKKAVTNIDVTKYTNIRLYG